MKARPAVRYYGSQFASADWIWSLMPAHQNRYVPFFGGGSEVLQFPPARNEVACDTDGRVVNFFKVLRDRPASLIEKILLTPWAKSEYEASGEVAEDPLEDARRFWVLCWMSIQGGPKPGKSGFRWLKDARGRYGQNASDGIKIDHLYDTAMRLKSVQFLNTDGIELIKSTSGVDDALFWCDPPFVHSTRQSTSGYREEWEDEKHRELSVALHQVKGYALITGYAYEKDGSPNELYAELYGDWVREDKACRINGGGERVQSIWLSQNTKAALNKRQMKMEL